MVRTQLNRDEQVKANPKIAVIGAGYWGKNLVRNFAQLGNLELICDSAPERRTELEKQYGVSTTNDVAAALSSPTITGVAIATPAETHGVLVRQALEAGKDVFVEKPLCLDVEEGRRLVELAREKKRVLMVGHLLWYHPAVLKLKELIDNGELGRIEYIYSNRLNMGKIRREENILWSFAPHDISVILGLLNETPTQVECRGGNYLHEQIADVTMTNLSFPSGVKGHIFVSWLHPFKEQKLVIVGDKKMAVFDDVATENKLVVYPHSVVWKDQVPVACKADGQPMSFEMSEPLKAECQHFLDRMLDRLPPRTDGVEGLAVLEVLNRCQESLEAKADEKTTPQTELAATYKAHESAFVDDGVTIGEGTKIWHVSHILKGSKVGHNCNIGQNVVVGPNASIGNGVKIQNNVSVYEGVTLEDDVFCGPSMVFTNVHNPRSAIRRMDELRPTLVKRGASLGANSTIVCGTTIGQYAFVGAGAVVTKDIPDYALVYGNPAQVGGWICECGVKLEFTDDKAECTCGRSYSKTNDQVEPLDLAPTRT